LFVTIIRDNYEQSIIYIQNERIISLIALSQFVAETALVTTSALSALELVAWSLWFESAGTRGGNITVAELAGWASVALALLEGKAQARSSVRSECREVSTASSTSITVTELARVSAIALASLEGKAQAGLRATTVSESSSTSSSSATSVTMAELALGTAIAFTTLESVAHANLGLIEAVSTIKATSATPSLMGELAAITSSALATLECKADSSRFKSFTAHLENV
jgi:hypothetical protein